MKLVDALDFVRPAMSLPVDPAIVSRNHDISPNTPVDVRNPFVMGNASLDFIMDGPRLVKLVGALTSSQAAISVDNFILIGILPPGAVGVADYYQAYGTADSTAYGNSSIQYRGEPVPLTPFSSGDTSHIPPISLDGQVRLHTPTDLELKVLDCGTSGGRGDSGNTSDIYALWQ